ncbi:MAG: Na/Pi cotransporter family protein [Bacillales bacterium]|nr:Na/Pi cotransporter family protein [Bacillales bacterium]
MAEIITLLVGSAIFITGMNMMSSGLKKATGKGLKSLLRKIQNSRLLGLLIGAAVTALIQSSAATSVMVIGFINAGIMSMFQGVSIMLGSFIGTTITGVLSALSSFDFAQYLLLLSFIGVVLMYFKNEKIKHIGEILCGLGILFFGLDTMKHAFADGSAVYTFCKELFVQVQNPVLLLIIGCLFTALVQSSSATSGIVIVMVGTNAISLSSGFYLVLGATIGTVITTLIATIGGTTNAKRAGFISLIIKAITATIGTLVVWLFEKPISDFFNHIFNNNYALEVAIFLVVYSLIAFSLMLPFIKPFVRLSEIIIREKPNKQLKEAILYIDDRMLNTPSIAMMQVKKEIVHMMELSYKNLDRGFNRIISQNGSEDKLIVDTEEKIDYINVKVTDFLIKLAGVVERNDEKKIGAYFHVINDIERIGDHAYNFYKQSHKMVEEELQFKNDVADDLNLMYKVVQEMTKLSIDIFEHKEFKELPELHVYEEQIDKLKAKLSEAHFIRILKDADESKLSSYFSTIVGELERIADHITNVGYSIKNPVGSENIL